MTASACGLPSTGGGGGGGTVATAVLTTAVQATATSSEGFTEDFNGSLDNWSHFVADASIQLTSPNSPASLASSDPSGMSLSTSNGNLVFDIESKGIWVYVTYNAQTFEDARVEVVADNRGVNSNSVSLICRYSDEGWYEFNVANSGLYNILYGQITQDQKFSYVKLADGGSNRIKQGKDVNTYTIICNKRALSLYINGFEVRRYDDNKYVLRDGKVGVGVSSFKDLPVKVEVQSITVSKP